MGGEGGDEADLETSSSSLTRDSIWQRSPSAPAMRPLLACTCARGLRVAVDPVQPFVRAYHASPVASTSGSQLAPGDKGKGVERWAGWKTVIGLELHVQLKGNVKLLSRESHPSTFTSIH